MVNAFLNDSGEVENVNLGNAMAKDFMVSNSLGFQDVDISFGSKIPMKTFLSLPLEPKTEEEKAVSLDYWR